MHYLSDTVSCRLLAELHCQMALRHCEADWPKICSPKEIALQHKTPRSLVVYATFKRHQQVPAISIHSTKSAWWLKPSGCSQVAMRASQRARRMQIKLERSWEL